MKKQENENENSKEAQQVESLKPQKTRKLCLETFAETKQRTQEEDNQEKLHQNEELVVVVGKRSYQSIDHRLYQTSS